MNQDLWSLSKRNKSQDTRIMSTVYNTLSHRSVYRQAYTGCRRCCFLGAPVVGHWRRRWLKKKGLAARIFNRKLGLKRVKFIYCRLYSTSSPPHVPVPSVTPPGAVSYENNNASQDEVATVETEKPNSNLQVSEKYRSRKLEQKRQYDVSRGYRIHKQYDTFGEEGSGTESTDLFIELRKWLIEGPDTAFKFSLASAIFVFVTSTLLQKILPHTSHDLIGLETMDTMFPSRQVTEEHLSLWEQLLRIVRGPYILVSLTMGFSSFTQAFAGFGFAVVAVGILSQFGWVVNSNIFQDIQPIAAIVGSLIGWTLVGTQWNKVQWKEVMPLLISCMISTPLGAWGLQYVNHSVSLHILGSLIFGFVIYSFSGLQPPRKWFANKFAAWTLGGLAGIFGGAFDINGPPLVFYGQAKQWHPEEFKRNILTVISLNSSFVVLFDALCGRLNDYYIGPFLLYSLPFVVTGTYAGVTLSKKLSPKRFKQAVLATCFIMSLRLLTS